MNVDYPTFPGSKSTGKRIMSFSGELNLEQSRNPIESYTGKAYVL